MARGYFLKIFMLLWILLKPRGQRLSKNNPKGGRPSGSLWNETPAPSHSIRGAPHSVFLLLCSLVWQQRNYTRGRTTPGPSLNLLNEHLLFPVMGIHAKEGQLLPLCTEACTRVHVCSRINENTRGSNRRKEKRIPVHHGCFVTRIYFFETRYRNSKIF